MFKKVLLMLFCVVFACLSVSAKKGEFKYSVFDVDAETNEVNLKTVSYNMSDFLGGLSATLIYDKDGCRISVYFCDHGKNALSLLEEGVMLKLTFADNTSMTLFYDGRPVKGSVAKGSQGDYLYTAYRMEFILSNAQTERLCNSPISKMQVKTAQYVVSNDKTGPKRAEKFRQAATDFYSYVPKSIKKMGTNGVVEEVDAPKTEIRYITNKVDEFTKARHIEISTTKISSTVSIGFKAIDKDYAIVVNYAGSKGYKKGDAIKFIFADRSANYLEITEDVSTYDYPTYNATLTLKCNRDMIEKFAQKKLTDIRLYKWGEYSGRKNIHTSVIVKTPEMAENVSVYAKDFLSKATKMKGEEDPAVKLSTKVYPDRQLKGLYYAFELDEADDNWYIHSLETISSKDIFLSLYYAKEYDKFVKRLRFSVVVPYKDMQTSSKYNVYLKLDNEEIVKLGIGEYSHAEKINNSSIYGFSNYCDINFDILKKLSAHKITKVRVEVERNSNNAKQNVEIDIVDSDASLLQTEIKEMLSVLDPRK